MAFSAFGLAAGRKQANARRPLPSAFLARNMNPRKAPSHPHVEGVVQEQVSQERAYHPTLRRPRSSRHNATILHLHRSLQPALDVEQHPPTVRMTTDCLEQQLPIDAVEVAPDIDIEHPVVAPTPLARRAHGIDCRAAGPVAIGVGMEHRLQTRLQITAGNPPGRAGPTPPKTPPAP